jgi:NAD(P) transhydrogenase subunit alpha
MVAGILKEATGDRRVALLPAEAAALKKLKIEVIVEFDAGKNAYAFDNDYLKEGVVPAARAEIIKKADILISVNPLPGVDITSCREGQFTCSVVYPVENREWLEKTRLAGLSVLALDLIPRVTRAQSMDILSSMATISGYKAVLDAAFLSPRFFPMFMSAAGTIKPSKVLILGAGIAGLQALAVARKLGAVVEVFDVRSSVKDEIKSLGGKFIEVEGSREDKTAGGYAVEQTEEYRKKQKELIHKRAISADVIITTALIPGKKAPLLISKETVALMKPGSVIVDLAAMAGGNCELTRNGEIIVENGVSIIGKSNYPSGMPVDASKMFGRNIVNLFKILIDRDGNLALNEKDDIVSSALAVRAKEYFSRRVKELLGVK